MEKVFYLIAMFTLTLTTSTAHNKDDSNVNLSTGYNTLSTWKGTAALIDGVWNNKI